MTTKTMHDAEHYEKKMVIAIRTPLQRLQNLKLMTGVLRDFTNNRVSAEVAEQIMAKLKRLDASAQRCGIADPIAMALPMPLMHRSASPESGGNAVVDAP